MTDKVRSGRRQLLKMGGAALAMIPVVGFSGNAFATQNAGVRASLKYVDKSTTEKHCAICQNFVPNKAKPEDRGGCKLYPGDTEISPGAYCMGFMAFPPKK